MGLTTNLTHIPNIEIVGSFDKIKSVQLLEFLCWKNCLFYVIALYHKFLAIFWKQFVQYIMMDYETQRKENIKKNAEIMKSLGLGDIKVQQICNCIVTNFRKIILLPWILLKSKRKRRQRKRN